ALWCYNIDKTCCGGEMVKVFKWMYILVEEMCVVVNVTKQSWVDGSGLNPGGGFGKTGGDRETRGGGDGLEGPDGQLTMV
nr:hypothetical protein [Tanacetum cinerariifolium]